MIEERIPADTAAKMLGVTDRYVRILARRGVLRSSLVGRKVFVETGSVEEYARINNVKIVEVRHEDVGVRSDPGVAAQRLSVKAILNDPELRREMMISCIVAIQATEGIETTREQAQVAYDHAVLWAKKKFSKKRSGSPVSSKPANGSRTAQSEPQHPAPGGGGVGTERTGEAEGSVDKTDSIKRDTLSEVIVEATSVDGVPTSRRGADVAKTSCSCGRFEAHLNGKCLVCLGVASSDQMCGCKRYKVSRWNGSRMVCARCAS